MACSGTTAPLPPGPQGAGGWTVVDAAHGFLNHASNFLRTDSEGHLWFQASIAGQPVAVWMYDGKAFAQQPSAPVASQLRVLRPLSGGAFLTGYLNGVVAHYDAASGGGSWTMAQIFSSGWPVSLDVDSSGAIWAAGLNGVAELSGSLGIVNVYTWKNTGMPSYSSARSEAHGVSADGSVVIGRAETFGGWLAFGWTTSGGLVGLDDTPGSLFIGAHAATSGGSVIVGAAVNDRGQHEAARWSFPSGAMTFLGDLNGGDVESVAFGVSSDGSVVVGQGESAMGTEAFMWTGEGELTPLGDLAGGAFRSYARAVSADASTIVGASSSAMSGTTRVEAFVYDVAAATMTPLGFLPGAVNLDSEALAVSADGSVIVGRSLNSSFDNEAFRFKDGVMQGLGTLHPTGSDTFSAAHALSADGSVIVGETVTPGGTRAFIWTESDGMRRVSDVLADHDISTTGWLLLSATGVSADGRTIVGYGFSSSGSIRGWVAQLPPGGPAADLTGDGVVNGIDLGILLANWSIPATAAGCGGAVPCAADINSDGFVNGLDLGVLLANWSL